MFTCADHVSFLVFSILFKNLCQRSPTTPPSENFKFRPRIKKIIHWEKEVEAEVKIGLGQGRVEEGGNPKHNIQCHDQVSLDLLFLLLSC